MSKSLLLDTNVASLIFGNRRRSPGFNLYASDLEESELMLSFQTIAELYFWADKSNWGSKLRAELEQYISGHYMPPVDLLLIRTWSNVLIQSRRSGRRLEPNDAWIVATAVRYNLPLVTHDRDMIGLPVEGLDVITHLK